MNKNITLLLVAFTAFLAIPFISCKKDKIRTSGGDIAFSRDTLLFDTVFTARGTSTRSVKIINKEKERMQIESIKLFRGNSSPFFINVNGERGKSVSNVNIEGKDSLYVFASVYINPDNQNDPFIVEDLLEVRVNGNTFTLPLLAFGQNAIYITDSLLKTQTWTSAKPYVIVQNALVDEGQTLTINPGTRVYVHADSRLFVVGSLKINGTQTDSVVFQGDRIDRRIYYSETDFVNGVGGEWGGLYFSKKSYNNTIRYAVFKNGGARTKLGDNYVADACIQLDADTVNNGTPKLKITNSIIRNSGGYGILAFASTLYAENNLLFACAKENIAILEGGKYEINGCTLASFASRINTATESHSSFLARNYRMVNNTSHVGNALNLLLQNTIIYGNTQNEVMVDSISNYPAQVVFKNCLMKQKAAFRPWTVLQNTLLNQDPLFENISSNDLHANNYRVKQGSPAIAAGITFPGMMPLDLSGKQRTATPTIGCYEF